jgi:uncharacterized protein (DUF2147 family)
VFNLFVGRDVMRKFVVIAALLMASASAAQAGSFSFNVEGQKVRVQIPRGCSSLSCINVSAPGLADKFKNKDDDSSTSTTTATAPAAAPAPAPAPAPQVAAAPPVAPAAAPQAAPKVTVLAPPTAEPTAVAPTMSAPAPTLATPEVSAQPAPAPVVAAPAPAPVQMAAVPAAPVATAAPAPVQQAATTPLGIWMSEKKEGKIRIEECGGNLCGYAIEKNGANGAKVLINMKPRGEKWVGRIHDTRSGGTYDSTIALRGNDKLKVQGCAMGGMFCGGETWTRIE